MFFVFEYVLRVFLIGFTESMILLEIPKIAQNAMKFDVSSLIERWTDFKGTSRLETLFVQSRYLRT